MHMTDNATFVNVTPVGAGAEIHRIYLLGTHKNKGSQFGKEESQARWYSWVLYNKSIKINFSTKVIIHILYAIFFY